MKAIVGYGATPEYRLSRTGQVLKNLDDFLKAPKKELKYDLQNDKGLRGWLAVQYQENPNADFKPKYAYEKLWSNMCKPWVWPIPTTKTSRGSSKHAPRLNPFLTMPSAKLSATGRVASSKSCLPVRLFYWLFSCS